MTDVADVRSRVDALVLQYRELAGAVRSARDSLVDSGAMTAQQGGALEHQARAVLHAANDILNAFDAQLAAQLDAPLGEIESATAGLVAAHSTFSADTIEQKVLGIVSACVAIAAAVAAPNPATVIVAVKAIEGVIAD